MKRMALLLACLGLLACVFEHFAAEPPRAKDDQAALEGTWRGFVVEGRGEKPDRGPVNIELVVKGNKMTARDLKENKPLGEGTYTLDAAKKPREIDATGSVSMGRNRTFQGIYELDGDTLRWCVDNINKGRPTEFLSTRGQYLLVLKRVR
jgi:uncharacterized protein (TIGR03067 family)